MASDALMLAFIEARPAAAARTLAAIPPDQAAALLDHVPARYAQQIASHTSAWIGASIFGRMEPLAAAAALEGLHQTEAAAILRLMPAEVRSPILEQAPASLRRTLESSLSFAPDAVGAHMGLAIIVLSQDETVADARAQARRHPEADADIVFIVDEERRLAGLVGAAALLQSPDSTPLRKLMQTEAPSLSPRTALAAAATLEAWRDYAALPVLNRHKQVIGALSRRAALAQAVSAPSPIEQRSSIAADLAEAFAASVLELGNLLTEREQGETERELEP